MSEFNQKIMFEYFHPKSDSLYADEEMKFHALYRFKGKQCDYTLIQLPKMKM